MAPRVKNIVCIGGGTGTYTVLRGLKHYPDLDLSAIVTTSDSGGSSGKLRNDLKMLPPGDVRQCLIALSAEDELMRRVFTYRFEAGDLKGHNLGNIILAGLSKITGSFKEAVMAASKILSIKGRVIPVTFTKTDLCAELSDGQIIVGETNIDEPEHDGTLAIKRVFLKPKGQINPEAAKVILEADVVVLGPGDLYTSLLATLLVPGMKEALRKTKGIVVYVCNLMTKHGQTNGMTASAHMAVLEQYLGRKVIDRVVLNKQALPDAALKFYQEEKEQPVVIDAMPKHIQPVYAQLLSERTFIKKKADILKRSLIRHSSTKLGRVLTAILYGKK